MRQTFATVRNGELALDAPVDWPDGTRVEVRPLEPAQDGQDLAPTTGPAVRQEFLDALNDPDSCGLDESLWPRTPEEIRLLLEHMDAAEPLEMSPEELAALDEDRRREKELQKEFTRKSWDELDKLFE